MGAAPGMKFLHAGTGCGAWAVPDSCGGGGRERGGHRLGADFALWVPLFVGSESAGFFKSEGFFNPAAGMEQSNYL